MPELKTIGELVAHGEQLLQSLSDDGNSIAQAWLTRVQAAPTDMQALAVFGDLKIALLSDSRAEAITVRRVMFPEE